MDAGLRIRFSDSSRASGCAEWSERLVIQPARIVNETESQPDSLHASKNPPNLMLQGEMNQCQRYASTSVILGEEEDADHEQGDAAGHDQQV
jgi:hypothetical protein